MKTIKPTTIFFVFFILFAQCFAQRARVVLDGKVEKVKLSGPVLINEILPEGDSVIGGYVEMVRGEFKTGPATINCGERLMKSMIRDKAIEMGATAFRLYDVREPNNVTNTCYRAKVLFMRKE